jgi:hypothetical protein
MSVIALTEHIGSHSTSWFTWMAAATAALTNFNHIIVHEQL